MVVARLRSARQFAASTVTLPDWVRPGTSFRLECTSDIYHVRAVVDGNMVTCRWSALKECYKYECLPPKFVSDNADRIKICA